MEKIIRIEWEGPYTLFDIGYIEENDQYKLSNAKLNDDKIDYGLYQIYGYHPVYGNNVLLYIGKTNKQTFAKRISDEGWEYNPDFKNIQIYVGRLFYKKSPSEKEWLNQINQAEKMLIYSHEPARNSSNILNITKDKKFLKEFENIRILNYDSHKSLMPEVSGKLWVQFFNDYNGVFEKS